MNKIDEIINTILSKTRSQKLKTQMELWIDYLNNNFTLPFETFCIDNDNTGEVKKGDTVIVTDRIYAYSEEGGLIVSTTHKGKYSAFELCYLKISDIKHNNYYFLEAYHKWYANL
jgi:hypothetical protein